MLVIPDYLIYDELQRREEAERDDGLQPLYLPLYAPEMEEAPRQREETDDSAPSRGVVIIDMNNWEIIEP